MTTAQQKPIYLYNSFVVRQQIRFFSELTNDWEPWAGSDIRARFSRYATGYDFNGYPSTLFGPYSMNVTLEAGWFFALVPSDDLTPVLEALVGQTIYLIVEGAYGGTYYDLTDSQPLTVVDPRVPIP